jgi:hypothetical protein
VSWEEEVRAFLERMGYTNVEHDVETNQLSADFWPPPEYREFKRSFDEWDASPPQDEGQSTILPGGEPRPASGFFQLIPKPEEEGE